jgi:K+/H+ antiporter YhaU regulatory subunit KhtT
VIDDRNRTRAEIIALLKERTQRIPRPHPSEALAAAG